MMHVPSLSTIDDMTRVDAALQALADVTVALSGSIVARTLSGDDGILSITTMSAIGHAVVERFEDRVRYRTVLRMTSDAHAPLMVSMPEGFHARVPTAECTAREMGEFAIASHRALSGATWREPGTEPPYDHEGVIRAFATLRAAVEAQGIEGAQLMTIAPASETRRMRFECDTRSCDAWEAGEDLHRMLAPLCLKADELSVCGTDAAWAKRPLVTHDGHIIRLDRPEQMAMHFECDPVATLRMTGGMGEGPWLRRMPDQPF
jgi:hypothetical protein